MKINKIIKLKFDYQNGFTTKQANYICEIRKYLYGDGIFETDFNQIMQEKYQNTNSRVWQAISISLVKRGYICERGCLCPEKGNHYGLIKATDNLIKILTDEENDRLLNMWQGTINYIKQGRNNAFIIKNNPVNISNHILNMMRLEL